MYEKLEICPICDHSTFENAIICKDYLVNKESFVIVKCTNCGFHFTNPRPTIQNIHLYYKSEDYASHSKKPGSILQLIYNFVRFFTLRTKRKIVNKNATKGKLLDIGCGTGNFMNICNQDGWNVKGMEPNQSANQIAAQKNNSTIYSTLKEIPTEDKYDAITLWHVLEHIHDLEAGLRKITALLKPNGTLFVAVPNHESYDAHHYGEYWAGWDLPRHLYHFTKSDIKTLLKRYSLKLKKTLPMKFDAYYVSLLSEKYKNGTQTPMKAFSTAKTSNRLAKLKTNYSSLIYIFKR